MKRLLILCLLLINPVRVQAETTKTILIYGDGLKDMYLITLYNDASINLISIPTSTLVQPTCASTPLSSLDALIPVENCLQTSIQENFKIPINNYVKLNLHNIDEDYALSLTKNDLHTFNDVQHYFDEFGASIHPSLIWKYKQYMDTNLNLLDLYDFYSLYTSDILTITYYHPFLIRVKNYWIPLSTSFYKTEI